MRPSTVAARARCAVADATTSAAQSTACDAAGSWSFMRGSLPTAVWDYGFPCPFPSVVVGGATVVTGTSVVVGASVTGGIVVGGTVVGAAVAGGVVAMVPPEEPDDPDVAPGATWV